MSSEKCLAECCQGLTGETVPADELEVALKFEDFASKEAVMCGWTVGSRRVHILAREVRRLRAELRDAKPDDHKSEAGTVTGSIGPIVEIEKPDEQGGE